MDCWKNFEFYPYWNASKALPEALCGLRKNAYRALWLSANQSIMQKILLPKGDFLFLESGDPYVPSRVPSIDNWLLVGCDTPKHPRSHGPVYLCHKRAQLVMRTKCSSPLMTLVHCLLVWSIVVQGASRILYFTKTFVSLGDVNKKLMLLGISRAYWITL